jgi:hypothetical protein
MSLNLAAIETWAAEALEGVRAQAGPEPHTPAQRAFIDGYEAALGTLLAEVESLQKGE